MKRILLRPLIRISGCIIVLFLFTVIIPFQKLVTIENTFDRNEENEKYVNNLRKYSLDETDIEGWFAYESQEILMQDRRDSVFQNWITAQTTIAAYERSLVKWPEMYALNIVSSYTYNDAFAQQIRMKDKSYIHPLTDINAENAHYFRIRDAADAFGIRIEFTKGALYYGITVMGKPGDYENVDKDAFLDLAKDIANLQYSKLPLIPNLTENTSISTRYISFFLIGQMIWGLILISFFVKIFYDIIDRGTRERLFGYVLGKRDKSPLHLHMRETEFNLQSTQLRRRNLCKRAINLVGTSIIIIILYTICSDVESMLISFILIINTISLGSSFFSSKRKANGVYVKTSVKTKIILFFTQTITSIISYISIMLFWLYFTIPIFGTGLDYDQESAVQIIFLLLGFILQFISLLPARVGRALSFPSAKKIREDDKNRKPILLLRSFLDDALKIRVHDSANRPAIERIALSQYSRFEELIAWKLWKIGPVITIGQPGTEKMPALGCAKEYCPPKDGAWKDFVKSYMQEASLLVFIVGKTEGLLEEIKLAEETNAIGKTLFILPPVANREAKRRFKILGASLGINPVIIDSYSLKRKKIIAVFFEEDGKPSIVTAGSRDDFNYEALLNNLPNNLANRDIKPITPIAEVDNVKKALPNLIVSRLDNKKALGFWHRLGINISRNKVIYILILIFSILGATAKRFSGENSSYILPDPPGKLICNIDIGQMETDSFDNLVAITNDGRQMLRISTKGETKLLTNINGYGNFILRENTAIIADNDKQIIYAYSVEEYSAKEIWSTSYSGQVYRMEIVGEKLFLSYNSDEKNMDIEVVSIINGGYINAFQVESMPLALQSWGNKLLVACADSTTLMIIDPSTLCVIESIEMNMPISGIQIDGDEIWSISISQEKMIVLKNGDISKAKIIYTPAAIAGFSVFDGQALIATTGREQSTQMPYKALKIEMNGSTTMTESPFIWDTVTLNGDFYFLVREPETGIYIYQNDI